jgi:hypothetical protein
MSTMNPYGIVTDSGRQARARHAKGEDIKGFGWIAIGLGDWPDKTVPPTEDNSITTLADETARKQIARFAFLELDNENGTILFNGNLYKEVAGPTNIILAETDFLESEANGANICEEGLFLDDAVVSAFPFAVGGEVSSPGTLVWVRNRALYIKGNTDTFTVSAFAIF